MRPTKQTMIALSTVAAAIILLASGPLVATHQTQAQSFCRFPPVPDCDFNQVTGNPHPPSGLPGTGDPSTPSGTEIGNPHNSVGCTGDPHMKAGTDACHGSQ